MIDRDELEKAEPMPLPVLDGEIESTPANAKNHNFTARLDALGGGATRPSKPPPGAAIVPQPVLTGPGPDTQQVVNIDKFPPRAIGRLYCYRQKVPKFGTGWVIGPRHIFTAAHCVQQNGAGWIDSALFIPRDGMGKPPIFRCLRAATPFGWTDGNPQKEPKDFLYDVAILETDKDLSAYCGLIGWQSPPSGNACTSLGYPQSPTVSLYRSTGEAAPQGDFAKMKNNMDAGCSGGPWIIWPSGNPVAIGINSFRLGDGTVAYSPPFGEAFLNLVQWADQN
ncbi:hypothetical protein A6768_11925 [Sphingobium yanoikuyae]|uniref:Serine protease n=1 Tax=Sphingobium yanoikuyae TaxID=13690 RepID=A0A291N0E4_SPHYA|nr:hypothetical protein A6768_11925 [Sphingobium yanoikuyae]